jgi:threonine synthase
VATALAASFAGLRCIVFIPETYHTKRIEEIEKVGAEIRRVPGDYERSVEISREFAAAGVRVVDLSGG